MGIWGKFIGGMTGLAFGGPLGALIGAAAGHAVDRMRDEPGGDDAPPIPGHGDFGRATRETVFSVAVIVLGAKMAKADGSVSRPEIDAFKQVFRVPPGEVRNVARIFDAAKRDADGYEPYARQVAMLFRREPALLEELLAGLFHIARADGPLNAPELRFLNRIAAIFGLDAAQFARVRDRFLPSPQADPYQVLGLTPNVSDAEIKQTYRRLIRENHPDTLIARGLPREMVPQATEKMAAINAAYDLVAKHRGLT